MRILSIGAGGWKGAFDLDKMGESKKMELLGLLDGKVWTGHNLAFDLLWIKHTATEVNPKMLIDTMFLATAIRPDIERMIHERIVATTIGGQQPVRLAGKNAGTVEQELQKILIERSASKNGKDDDAKSAYPLATLSLVFLNEKLDKSFQNSTNWMPSVLTADHLNYCIGDITAPAIIARRMLKLCDDAPIADVIAALDIKKVPGAWAYLRAFEPAARRLVDCTLKGISLSHESIAEYRDALQAEADIELEKVLKMAEELGPFRDRLRLKPGMTNDLKEAYATALHRRTGIEVERSEVKKKSGSPEDDQQERIDFDEDDLSGQKKGALRLGSDYLKERFPGEPLVDAMQALSGALKRRDMIDDYAVYAGEDGRVHGTITVGTITGRTRSSNPNMQNAPRNAAFRACFAATPGHQILAIDYSAMELRIAAALGARAYGQFLKMMENPHKSKAKWILKMPGMMDYIQGRKPLPGNWPLSKPDYMVERKPSISDYGLAYGSQLAAICQDLRARGAAFRDAQTDLLTFREVFRVGLDPHILTAVTMESLGGRFDTGGWSPLDYLKSLPQADAKALKKMLAEPRQAAKAVAFGLIYGMSVRGLHSSGITGYGLSWDLEEAAAAAQAFFSLYPEVALWHWMNAHAGGKTKSHVLDTRRNECKTDGEGGSFYRGRTISGRVVEGLELREALNYSDQGTGGEIALHAIANLSDDIANMLVGFVHDELIFEVPTNQAETVSKEVERVMNEAAEALLLLYKVPSGVEAALGQHWIH
ncbi:MAG: DNA polymerase [Acidithiobacillus sp.]